MLFDGWVLRFTRGFTKRANSVTPLYASTQPLRAKVRYCEDLYAREGLRTIFRLTTAADDDGLDALLSERGYDIVDPTQVLCLDLASRAFRIADGFAPTTLSSFLASYARLASPGVVDGAAQSALELHAMVLRSIRGETVFGFVVDNGEPVACGMAVVEREVAGLFDVVVHPDARRRGHGRALVESLLARAREMGARYAYLQVLEDNSAARALYEPSGFELLYEYRYRLSKNQQR